MVLFGIPFVFLWTVANAQSDVYSTFFLYGNDTCTGTPLQITSAYVLIGQCTPAPCRTGTMTTCTNTVPSIPKGYAVTMTFSKQTCSAGQPILVIGSLANTCFATPTNSLRYDIGSTSIRQRAWSNPSCSGTAPVDVSVNFGCTVVSASQSQLVMVSNAASSLVAWVAFACFATFFL